MPVSMAYSGDTRTVTSRLVSLWEKSFFTQRLSTLERTASTDHPSEALYQPPQRAGASVRQALALVESDADGPGTIPRFRTPAALALTGSSAEALPLVRRAEQDYPEATFVRTILGPVTRAAIALHGRHSDEALAALAPATQTELGTMAGLVPPYLRAQALLQKGAFADAVKEFQKLVDHRGVDPFAPMIPLAHLGIARAQAAAGDLAASRRAYDELFRIWQRADADLAPLVAARAEYARLTGPSTAQ